MTSNGRVLWTAALVTALGLGGCAATGTDQGAPAQTPPAAEAPAAAVAPATGTEMVAVGRLSPIGASTVSGTVTFTKVAEGVRVVADVTGLTPGEHGFHVHENGDCSGPDASLAGAHYNPTGKPHAGPDAAERHVGDLGNITADAQGNAHYERTDATLALEGDHSIVGRAVIVHGVADDLTSQPSGNAGPRVACGVIERR